MAGGPDESGGEGGNGRRGGKHRGRSGRRRFKPADTAQQIVGGFLLAGPFVVTEEVWALARNMSVLRAAIVVGIVATISYATLYKTDPDHDPDRERDVGGIPLRFLSSIGVSFGVVAVLAVVLGAPATFLSDIPGSERAIVSLRAVSVGAIFSVVGAATADSVL